MGHDRDFKPGEIIPGTRYRVQSLIGVGGMGSVYAVEHVELGRRFVLKALLRDLSVRDELVKRLRNEWRALGRLEHPNIVSVTDAGVTDDNLPYYVMQHLEGETLASRLGRLRTLAVPEAVAILQGVTEALGAAHRIGIVHRDVKPQNIFIPQRAPVKLLDFGIAKARDGAQAITAKGVAIGTPRYMSPEQARGDKVDGRADLYAVGLILFECVAGHSPFGAQKSANELLFAHLQELPPTLASVRPGVAPELSLLIGELLDKDPRRRPESAEHVVERLRSIAKRFPSQTRGETTRGETTRNAPYESATPVQDPRRLHGTRPDGIAAQRANGAAGATRGGGTTEVGVPFLPADEDELAAASASGPGFTQTAINAPLQATPSGTSASGTLILNTGRLATLQEGISSEVGRTAIDPVATPLASTLSEPTEHPTYSGHLADLDETRTHVEVAETPRATDAAERRGDLDVDSARNVTPPPVEGSAARPVPPRSMLLPLALLLGAAAFMGVGVAAYTLLQRDGEPARDAAEASHAGLEAPLSPAPTPFPGNAARLPAPAPRAPEANRPPVGAETPVTLPSPPAKSEASPPIKARNAPARDEPAESPSKATVPGKPSPKAAPPSEPAPPASPEKPKVSRPRATRPSMPASGL